MFPLAVWLLFSIVPLASSDLLLSTLRSSTSPRVSASTQQQPLPAKFLPLCGNGRLDALEHYRALADKSSATFSLPTGSLTAHATEVCDDGNRLDNDGCSADCMQRDLWTSPCRLRIDGGLRDAEAILPYTDESMLVSSGSAFTVVQSMPRPGDRSLNKTLSFRKDYKVTSMFRTPSNTIVAYSSMTQILYLIDIERKTSTSMLDLSAFLQTGRSDPAYRYASSADVLVLRDSRTIVLISLATLTMRGKCTVGLNMDRAVYLDDPNGEDVLTIRAPTGMVQVRPIVGGVRCDETSSTWGSDAVGDMWRDSFRSMMDTVGDFRYPAYSMATFQADGNKTASTFRGQSAYLPVGLWVESSPSFLRELVNAPVKVSSAWVGHTALIDAYSSASPVCSSSGGSCALDVPPSYDLVKSTSWSATRTWQLRLQSFLTEAITGVANFPALYANTVAYARLWAAWTADVSQNGMDRRLKDFAVHPRTGNLWVVSGDGELYEISKSGVTLPVDDRTGRCMPSGVAMCESCMWAEAGGACKPCKEASTGSWAWSVQCKSCETSSAGTSSRRIEFSAAKRFALPLCAQGVTWSDNAGVGVDAHFNTKTPVECMRALAEVMPGSPVVTKPSVVIWLDSGEGGVDYLVVIFAVLGAIVGVLVLYGMWSCCKRPSSGTVYVFGPQGGGSHAQMPSNGPNLPRIVFTGVSETRFGDLKLP